VFYTATILSLQLSKILSVTRNSRPCSNFPAYLKMTLIVGVS
jgi:hypothetical protein